jgi:NAD(P)H-dependent FMN reductase
MTQPPPLRALGISGSPSATSRSRLLVARALERMDAAGAQTRLLDLGDLPANGLPAGALAELTAHVSQPRK